MLVQCPNCYSDNVDSTLQIGDNICLDCDWFWSDEEEEE